MQQKESNEIEENTKRARQISTNEIGNVLKRNIKKHEMLHKAQRTHSQHFEIEENDSAR